MFASLIQPSTTKKQTTTQKSPSSGMGKSTSSLSLNNMPIFHPPSVFSTKANSTNSSTSSLSSLSSAESNKKGKGSTFNPSTHLSYDVRPKVYSMDDIGLTTKGISTTAISEPFPLFTEEAVQLMRKEMLSKDVLENCIDLVPVMDFEIGHINLSISKPTTYADRHIDDASNNKSIATAAAVPAKPVVDWHKDSYQFVCVLMLSDCTNVVGGETALRTGSGEIMKVTGPGMGNAVILQGRYIEHIALPATGTDERITMVTSFRPKNPLVRDDTVLTTVRPVSDLSELYGGYTDYRLDVLAARTRDIQEKIRERKAGEKRFDTKMVKAWLKEQMAFVGSMVEQLVDENQVVAGLCDTTHLVSEDLKMDGEKKKVEWSAERA
ncbi:hypothetical protein LTR66_015511 [Elasticomyces elasticus]|nr:hypothetical protein LTR66_015511 [Elasticomyces elasticus]